MRKNPEGARRGSPENAGVRNRYSEANRKKEGSEAAVPSQGSLLEAVYSCVELEENVLTGEISCRREHEHFFFQIAGEEGAFEVKLVD